LAGTDNSIVKSITIYQEFTVIERGISTEINKEFSLEKFIKRRPFHPGKNRVFDKLKGVVKRTMGR